jgi:hypothetical protein
MSDQAVSRDVLDNKYRVSHAIRRVSNLRGL